jgi:asparagine synthase (glutamine-hydrolysing)
LRLVPPYNASYIFSIGKGPVSGCFGIFEADGATASSEHLMRMDAAMAFSGPHGGGLHSMGPIALGSRLLHITPEDRFDEQPISGAHMLVSHVRLDNRRVLATALGIPADTPMADSALIVAAYQRWGEACTDHLMGDWVFALWDAQQGRLLIARDATGNSGLYWWSNGNTFVFSTGIQGVLAHPEVPRKPNELAIAGLLTIFRFPEDEDGTVFSGIRRLRPGHCMKIDKKGIRLWRWWEPERLPPLEFGDRRDYHEAFLSLYSDAVSSRLRVEGGTVAATLSGGLDSGSMVALAAPQLAARGQRLAAYVHRPLYAPASVGGNKIGDEFELAHKTAEFVGNVDPISLFSENASIVTAIRQGHAIHGIPEHAVVNLYWMLELLETARSGGARVLLTGQGGNATVSYAGNGNLLGDLKSGRVSTVWNELVRDESGFWQALKGRLAKPMLRPLRGKLAIHGGRNTLNPWQAYAAINPCFCAELNLLDRMRDAGHDPSFNPLLRRNEATRNYRLGLAKNDLVGQHWMEYGAAFGLDIRDPTMDRRVVEFCWQVPDRVFWAQGRQRGLIRDVMRAHLPAEVIFNPRRGLQSADIAGRILAQNAEIEDAIRQLDHTPLAKAWLDIPYMLRILENLKRGEGAAGSASTLLRALGVGIFLSGL